MSSLNKFGQFIVANLRDKAIEQHLMLQRGELRGKSIQDLQSKVASLPAEEKEIIRRVVVDALDTALHDFLFALQDAHDRERGIVVTVDGENVAAASGMLHGEQLGEEGWVKRFSRFADMQK